MSVSTHRIRVAEARRIKHPVHPEIEKHYFLVRAAEMPAGISTGANARSPEGMNRHVYRDVAKSLIGDDNGRGHFDLMNKGIVCLARSVRRLQDDLYELEIDDESEGIVDGGHTYQIICSTKEKMTIPDEQFVEMQVRTGIPQSIIADISRGLNTGIQVAQHSLSDLAKHYQWIRDITSNYEWHSRIAWSESDKGEYDVRDLICILEALNVIDWPNDKSSSHPISAYEKWSVPTNKFATDAKKHAAELSGSTYYRLGPILTDALVLSDRIKKEFRDRYNKLLPNGKAARLDIVEDAGETRKFEFPFAGLSQDRYRLTKGAFFPIFAAFRNAVEIGDDGKAKWMGGFQSVLDLWDKVAPEMIAITRQAIKDIGSKPDVIGKNRGHWTTMHQTIELHILREKMKARSN